MTKIKKNAVKKIRDNVTVIKETNVASNYELDFEVVNRNRKTIAEVVTASKIVKGDMVYPDDECIKIERKDEE